MQIYYFDCIMQRICHQNPIGQSRIHLNAQIPETVQAISVFIPVKKITDVAMGCRIRESYEYNNG